jgi:MFS family permease
MIDKLNQQNVTDKQKLSKAASFSVNVLPWVMFALGALYYCYEYLLRISPSVMTGKLMADFSIGAGALGNFVAYYYYIYTPMQLPVGVLMDRYGPRRLLAFACLICVLGAFWFGSTQTAQAIGYSRLLMGLGSAFAFVGVLKIASLWLPENHFALASGFAYMLGTIGAMVGDDVMSSLVEHVGWRTTINYAALIGIVLAVIIFLVLRDRPAPHRQILKPALPETTFKMLGSELLHLIKNPLIWINGLVGGLLYLPVSAFAELWGLPFIQNTYHISRESSAHVISIMFLGIALGAPLAGWLSDKLRRRCLPIIISAIICGVLALVIVFVPMPRTALYVLLFFFGMVSSVQILVFPIARELSPDNLAGTAVAFTNMLTMFCGMIFQPLIGRLLDLGWNGLKVNNVPVYTVTDYRYALFSIPIAMFFALILMIFMKETHAEVKG